jgi:transcriptional regulator
VYTPPHFKESSPEALHGVIRRFPLATLVVPTASGLEATHVPMLLEEGVLRGHVARANPLWHAATGEALAIFQGPQHYISPNFYASKQSDARVVPTWNYIAVHAYGPLRAFDDADELRRVVTALTDTFEAGSEHPWRVSDAPVEYIDRLLGAIVGLEIPIARLEGKWKASQNRSADDRASVRAALGKFLDAEIAELGVGLVAE